MWLPPKPLITPNMENGNSDKEFSWIAVIKKGHVIRSSFSRFYYYQDPEFLTSAEMKTYFLNNAVTVSRQK